MCEKIVVVIFTTIIFVNSERWYSATFLDREPYIQAPIKENTFNAQAKAKEHRYMPLELMKQLKPVQKQNYYNTKTENGFKDNITPEYFKAEDVMINFNHTLNNINILKRTRPKRRNGKCPVGPKRTKNMKQYPKAKFLDVFQVVEFRHETCISSSGLEGICLHEYECTVSGGFMMGTCADGYGTCCVTQFRCDTSSSAPVGWFTNPEFPLPSTERLTCTVTLDKATDDIKQIRLDFNTFELLPPIYGVCQQDQFIVSGQNMNNIIPILCGVNTGQHVYVEVSETERPIVLTIQTESAESRIFAIKVTQLTWADDLAAPSGCLQYSKDDRGYLESFNYREKSEIAIARASNYMNNLNYAICIERVPGACSVTYTNAGNMQIVNYDTDGLPVIPPGQAGVEILNCPSDWLLIAATRLCGERLNDGSVFQDFSLNAPITDTSAGPIVIWFRSDEAYVGYGFKLLYQQNTCT